jgi:hypothetical protein
VGTGRRLGGHLTGEIEGPAAHQNDAEGGLTQVQERHAGGRRGQQGGEIAQAEFRDVDHIEGSDPGKSAGMPIDGAAPRRNGIHHAPVTPAVLIGHVEDVDNGVLDSKIDGLLEPPPHRSTQLRGGNVGGLDQRQLIVVRLAAPC